MFGEDVNEFNPHRWTERKGLERSPSWRPFGGGQTLCPGRFVAQQTVLTFVAMVVWRFEIEVAGGEGCGFPRADKGKPVLGVMGPLDDVLVNMRPREGL